MAGFRFNELTFVVPSRESESGLALKSPLDRVQTKPIRLDEVLLLQHCVTEREREEIVSFAQSELGMRQHEAETVVSELISTDVLIDRELPEGARSWYHYNWTRPLMYLLASRTVPTRDEIRARQSPVRLRRAHAETSHTEEIELPDPGELPETPVTTVLDNRRTCRRFTGSPVGLDSVSTVLHHAAYPMKEVRGKTGDVAHPEELSDDELEALAADLYLLATDVPELDRDVYRYSILDHALYRVDNGTRLEQDPPPLLNPTSEYIAGTGFVVLLGVRFDYFRKLQPYSRALRDLFMHLSRIAHRLLLVATALDFNVYQSGAINHEFANEIADLNGYDQSIMFLVGVGDGDLMTDQFVKHDY